MTTTQARAVRHSPLSDRLGTLGMPRAAASRASRALPTSHTARRPSAAATSQRASAPSAMPTAQPKTHSSRERGTTRVRMRPAAYSGIVASFRAFPAPNEKDAITRAYRARAMAPRCVGLLLERAQRDGHRPRLAVADEGDLRLASGGSAAHLCGQIGGVGDGYAVEAGHDVARGEARRRRGAAVGDLVDVRPGD